MHLQVVVGAVADSCDRPGPKSVGPGIEKTLMREAVACHAATDTDNDETTDTDKDERRAADAFGHRAWRRLPGL